MTEAVVDIVAGLTGYPPDLLDLDLDLEADLGVDTVKQAEVFAAVRERFNVPRDENLRLRDFPTLTHVIGWIQRKDRRPTPHPTHTSRPQPTTIATTVTETPAAQSDEVTEAVVGIVAGLTGYPTDLLDLDLDLEADLGVDTVKQAEVFAAVRERFNVPRDENLRLRDFPTLTHVIGWIQEKTADRPHTQPTPADPTHHHRHHRHRNPGGASDEVTEAVVGIVAGLTGYPTDLLDLDLDLEADLGVDTVKQAEVFAAVRERFNVPRDENLRLRDFPTLTHVIGWIHEKTADRPHTQPTPADTQTFRATNRRPVRRHGHRRSRRDRPDHPARAGAGPPARPGGLRADRCDAGRRYPGRAPARPGRRRRGPGRPADPAGRRGAAARPGRPDRRRWTAALAGGAVHGVYWLAALDDEGPLDQLDLAGWQDGAAPARRRPLPSDAPAVRAAARSWSPRTRLGGFHGYDEAGATCPLGGAVTGFAKAYRRERPQALVKAVDFPVSRKTAALADLLVEETLRDPGCVEVGLRRRRPLGRRAGRAAVPGRRRPAAATTDPDGGRVFLVTGAAGSIVSAITADLATAFRGTFHLLDLTPAPDPTDRGPAPVRRGPRRVQVGTGRPAARARRAPDPGRHRAGTGPLRTAPGGARRGAGRRAGRRLGPLPQRRPHRPGRRRRRCWPRSARSAAGSTSCCTRPGWRSATPCRTRSPASSTSCSGVKADGLFNVLHAAGDLPLGTVVGFSSVAGRFGNAGQTDYSAANDLLCKVLSGLRHGPARRPGAWPSTGPPGAGSAWRPAARSRRSWRRPGWSCCRRRPGWPGSAAS